MGRQSYSSDTEGTPVVYTPPTYSDEEQIDNDLQQDIHQLARQITSSSLHTKNGVPVNPFIDSEDPSLDPYSEKFSSKSWQKHVMNVQKRDPNRPPPLTTGVAFRHMGAYGYGSGADYQKTVGNVLLEAVTLAKKLTGMEKKTRIDILRDFDGLVRCGEACVVLGRPGSGCSTFLKSIACNDHGFYLTENSTTNYQGMLCV